MSNFIIQFPLKTEIWQEDILNKRFEIGRKMYNSLVNISQKRYNEMIKTTKYRDLWCKVQKLSKNKKSNKKELNKVYKQLSELRTLYRLTEYDF